MYNNILYLVSGCVAGYICYETVCYITEKLQSKTNHILVPIRKVEPEVVKYSSLLWKYTTLNPVLIGSIVLREYTVKFLCKEAGYVFTRDINVTPNQKLRDHSTIKSDPVGHSRMNVDLYSSNGVNVVTIIDNMHIPLDMLLSPYHKSNKDQIEWIKHSRVSSRRMNQLLIKSTTIMLYLQNTVVCEDVITYIVQILHNIYTSRQSMYSDLLLLNNDVW
jgi:hypothetical protein